jgi:hypothetical protein
MPMPTKEAQKLMQQLGASSRNDSCVWFLYNDKYDTRQEFENHLTHAAIASLVHVADKNNKVGCPVSKEDVIRLAVYLAQNQDVYLL